MEPGLLEGDLRILLRRAGVLALSLVGMLTSGIPAASAAQNPFAPEIVTRGQVDRAVLMCDFPDSPDPEFDRAHFVGLFAQLVNYFDEASYGALRVSATVHDWRDLPHDRAHYGLVEGGDRDSDALLRDCLEVHGNPDNQRFEGADVVLGELERNVLTGVGGATCLALSDCWQYTLIPAHQAGVAAGGESRNGMALWAHEMGHSLGLAHSSASFWDPMSSPCSGILSSGQFDPSAEDPTYGCIPVHYLAAQKDDFVYKVKRQGKLHYGLDWIPAARKATVDPGERATVKLERLAKPGSAGDLIARMPVGSKAKVWITAEARIEAPDSRYDSPATLPGSGVVISKVRPARPDFVVEVEGDDFEQPDKALLTPGEKYKKSGITVKVRSKIGDRGFTIKVKNAS